MKFGYLSHSPVTAKTSSSHLINNLFKDTQHELVSLTYSQNTEEYYIPIPKVRNGPNRMSKGIYGMIFFSEIMIRMKHTISTIENIIERESIDALLYYISDLRSMMLVPYVLNASDIPVVVMMWDPPEYNYYMHGIGKHVQKAINSRIYYALHSASGAILISSALRKRYPNINNTCIINHTVVTNSTTNYKDFKQENDYFKIGYAGSGYAYMNWKYFLEAIDAIGWKTINGSDIQLHCLGRLNETDGLLDTDNERIFIHGYLGEKEQIDILSTCDLLYLPYWFGQEYRPSVKYCFPGKLGVYAAAGVPILYHGPESAGVLDALTKYNTGPCIFTEKLIMNKIFDEYQKHKENWFMGVRMMRSRLLNLEVMQDRFSSFIEKVIDTNIKMNQ